MAKNKAFSLIEIVIFISILSIIILAILQSVTKNHYSISNNTESFSLLNVTFCKDTIKNCIYRSNLSDKLHFYEIGLVD